MSLATIAARMRAYAERAPVGVPSEAHAWRPPNSHGALVVCCWCDAPGSFHLSISRRHQPPGDTEIATLLRAFAVPQGIEMEHATQGAWFVRRVTWRAAAPVRTVRRAPRKITIPIEELL